METASTGSELDGYASEVCERLYLTGVGELEACAYAVCLDWCRLHCKSRTVINESVEGDDYHWERAD